MCSTRDVATGPDYRLGLGQLHIPAGELGLIP
jgi:hypothetical protein